MDAEKYIVSYGALSHGLFALLFFRYVTKINTKRVILLLGHLLITVTMLLRVSPQSRGSNLTCLLGSIAHVLIAIFFIITTFIFNNKYRLTFDKGSDNWLNILCIVGQLGMIIMYGSIYFKNNNREIFDKYENELNYGMIVTFMCLTYFYYRVTLKQKKGEVLVYPLGMICILYLLFFAHRVYSLKN